MGSFLRRLLYAATLSGVCFLQACAALPPLPQRTESRALPGGTPSAFARKVAAERGNASAAQSGVRLLAGGEEALSTLLALVDGAEHTLDLQYYAVLNEASTRLLLQRVLAAADRGVRVRLLIDDFNTSGTDDALLRLTRHPRLEVRLYNPLPGGRFSLLTRVIASLHDVARINNRMHNKQLVADNALAVTGGRNLGDAYFLQGAKANFVDLDLLVAGPVVQQLSATFDRYWASDLAYPADAIIAPQAGSAPARPASAEAAPVTAPTRAVPPQRPPAGSASQALPEVPPGEPASAPNLPPVASAPMDAPSGLDDSTLARLKAQADALRAGPLHLQWMPARLWADRPSKTSGGGNPSPDEIMFDDFAGLMRSARQQVFLVTPYFVPGEPGMGLIRELRQRGVRVRILTASLAGTDAPAVHLGYSRYREELLRLGVELYELRAEPGGPKPPRFGGVHSRTNLHAKAMLVDAGTVVVGSMNFDPRSANLNTEMGLVTRSTRFAAQVDQLLTEITQRAAWRLSLQDGGLLWTHTDDQGQPLRVTHEPDTSLLKRLGLKLLGPLAPEEML
ncbi:phospholipase D-like domain-containing protein [Aquincola tertiaricarbonis]|uniref:Phospholipase D-like domain-containing protein n=1 Tax=Aquincola tertiaricarbonis TaxID=391953 RepID=A0ABY4SG68_AQUTE|nr:phospholipase D-like domain-containing protein [Aquincola tertiaricarbonis]URI10199.1 phospholipase D-like domain-containing protein [Aquincola tertiaricarbonis]